MDKLFYIKSQVTHIRDGSRIFCQGTGVEKCCDPTQACHWGGGGGVKMHKNILGSRWENVPPLPSSGSTNAFGVL